MLARRTRQTQPYAMHATSPRVNAIHARAQPTGLIASSWGAPKDRIVATRGDGDSRQVPEVKA